MGYGQSAFRRAVEILATEASLINERLAGAICTEILPLSREEIPRNPPASKEHASCGCESPEIRDEFDKLRMEVTDSERLTDSDAVRARILSYPLEKATQIALHVFQIYNLYVLNHPWTRFIKMSEAKARLAKLWLRLPVTDRTEDHMLLFWGELHFDRAEVVNVRYGKVDPWQKIHGWLLQIDRENR